MVRYIAEDESDELTLQEPASKAYLVLLANNRISHSFPLRSEVQIGREKSNGVVVSDQKVSRHHAGLTPIDDTFILSDLGSANGTYLNGVLISQPTRLKDKDRIKIGDTTFLFTNSVTDPDAIQQPTLFESKPVLVQSPSASPFFSMEDKSTWFIIGCMSLVIVGLLIALAGLVGLFIGRVQIGGMLVETVLSLL